MQTEWHRSVAMARNGTQWHAMSCTVMQLIHSRSFGAWQYPGMLHPLNGVVKVSSKY